MDDNSKPEARLLAELADLRRRNQEFEAAPGTWPKEADEDARWKTGHESLIENCAFGVFVATSDDRFSTVNIAMAEMLGYGSEEELLSVRPSDLYERSAEREAFFSKHRHAERIEGVEARWRKKDGTPIRVRLSGRPVRCGGGSATAFQIFAEDVTHFNRLEEQLRQAQKMEAVGRLTGGIAHNFNNLLSIILSNADLVRRRLPPDDAFACAELEEVQAAAERGASMIKKLLGFTRHDKLDIQDVDPGSLVETASRMMERLLPENIDLKTSIDGSVGLIQADAGAVEEVLLNLATNARDAMPQGGSLRIEVRGQCLDEAYCSSHPWVQQGEHALISVSDTGVGMDEETQKLVFEPFFTNNPRGAGTGLGMSMVYGLVKQHGGSVDLYSEPGHGTTVKLYFPLAGQCARRARRCLSFDSNALFGSATILIVEDDAALRRAAKRVLENQGFSVFAAADGEEALFELVQHGLEIDLVFSDLVMPKLGGADLYRAAKETWPHTRFIFTSGFSQTEVQERQGIGAEVLFLQKPWSVTELLWAVADALAGEVTKVARA